MLTDRELRRFFAKKAAGARTAFSRAVDGVGLRIVAFLASSLLFRALGYPLRYALLLGAIAFLLCCAVLALCRRVAAERILPREMEKFSRALLKNQLMLLEEARFSALCRSASSAARPVALQRAEPVGTDTLLVLLRRARGVPLTVCSTSGFTPAAADFASQSGRPVTLLGMDALLDAAMREEDLAPTAEEIHAAIEEELRFRVRRRKRLQALPFFEGSGRKYLFAAGVLLLLSLVTRYTLYYRMLAGLCFAIAMTRFVLDGRMHAVPPA